MYMPKFELLSFATLPPQRKQTVLRAALEFLICADWNYILENPDLPALYDSNAQYVLKVRPGGLDSWQDIPQTLALQSGDCKDFACWRVAELRNQGYADVYPHVKVSYHEDPSGREPMLTVYHIQVRVHDIIEDPSAILGMPKSASYAQLRGDPEVHARAAGEIATPSPDQVQMYGDGGGMYHQPNFGYAPYGNAMPIPGYGSGPQPFMIEGY